MVCSRCNKTYVGYRCPHCGHFILQDAKGPVYSAQMQKEYRKELLKNVAVLGVFAFLIGIMAIGLSAVQGGKQTGKEQTRAAAKDVPQVEPVVGGGEIYSDQYMCYVLTQVAIDSEQMLTLSFDVTNQSDSTMSFGPAMAEVNGHTLDCYYKLGDFHKWQPGQTLQETISIECDDLELYGIESIDTIKLYVDPLEYVSENSAKYLSSVSFSVPCKYTGGSEAAVDIDSFTLLYEDANMKVLVAPESEYNDKKDAYGVWYYLCNKRDEICTMSITNVCIDGTVKNSDNSLMLVDVAPHSGVLWQQIWIGEDIMQSNVTFDLDMQDSVEFDKDYSVTGIKLH